MRGEKIEQSFDGAVLLCEVCRRVGLPFNIYAFGTRTERLLHHDEPLTDGVRAKLGALPESPCGGTNLTAALEMVSSDIGESPFKDRFVFVISDGEPDDDESAHQQIASMAADGISLLGLGLGPKTVRLRDFFPLSQVNLNANQLSGALSGLLVRSLHRK
jgi:uncharacterized protein YegL